MTTETITDVKSEIALPLANILTVKLKVMLPPTGCFSSADICCRKRCNANEFWSRWHKDSWIQKRIFHDRDIVILKAKVHWNYCPVLPVIETFADKHGVAQIVRQRLKWKKRSTRTSSTESKDCFASWGQLNIKEPRNKSKLSPIFDGELDETSTWQWARDYFSHMRAIKYNFHYV